MMDAALQAFVDGDVKAAQGIIDGDCMIDQAVQDVFTSLFEAMRMGDHATNVAEMVTFTVRGQDVRHLGRLPDTTTSAAR